MTGLPGRGVVIVTAGEDGAVFYPMLRGVTPADRRRGVALADDELAVNAVPRPISLVGTHAYQVIDIPAGQANSRSISTCRCTGAERSPSGSSIQRASRSGA